MEPIVVTACEFLEQSASSVAQAVTLVGYVLLFPCGFGLNLISYVKMVEDCFLYLLGIELFDCCFEL